MTEAHKTNRKMVSSTLGNVDDLIGAAVNVEALRPDVALRYRMEAAALIREVAYKLLTESDNLAINARTSYTVACESSRSSKVTS